MATIHFHETTTATPEQFLAGLTDFGPGRSKLFGNSADEYLEVHDQGADYADVTEGSAGIWERLHYDWSDSRRVVMTTTDSNVWGGRSGHTYTLIRQPDGTTHVDVVVVREGTNLKGRLLALVIGSVGKGRLGKELGKTIKAIEARNDEDRLLAGVMLVGRDRRDLAGRVDAGHLGAVSLRELDRERAAAAGAVDEHRLTGSHLSLVTPPAERDQR